MTTVVVSEDIHGIDGLQAWPNEITLILKTQGYCGEHGTLLAGSDTAASLPIINQ